MKAEERALEKYPLMADDDKEGLEALKYIGIECECASVFNEAQEAKQAYFIEGYRQAEKDLELTWEDMEAIQEIANNYTKYHTMESRFFVYSEVLKQFKDFKQAIKDE